MIFLADNRITVLNIIISDRDASGSVNELLHEFGEYILGRMGLPYGEKNISVICVVMDIPTDRASALSGRLGMINGVTAKLMTAKV